MNSLKGSMLTSMLSVADPGGAEGTMAPPGPVKIGHKKDGHRRQLHRFHVSRPPLTRPLDPLLAMEPNASAIIFKMTLINASLFL